MTKGKAETNGMPTLVVEGTRAKMQETVAPVIARQLKLMPGPRLSKKQKKRAQKQAQASTRGIEPAEASTKGIETAKEPAKGPAKELEERLGVKRKAPSDDDSLEDQAKRNRIQPPGNSITSKSTSELPARPTPLPENTFINKRPLFHPPIPSPYSGPDKQKTIYLSANASFIGTVKRVQKLMLFAEKRFNTKLDASQEKKAQKSRGAKSNEKEEIEEVVLKGTGRAIERVVSIAVFLQAKEEYAVRLKVGSVSVVDDIEKRQKPAVDGKNRRRGEQSDDADKSVEAKVSGAVNNTEATSNGADDGDESEEEPSFEISAMTPKERPLAKPQDSVPVPEARVRNVSMMEVGITLKSILRYEQGHGKKVDGYPSFS